MKRLIIFFTIPLLFAACDIFEPYDKIYYHDVGAEGYVYYEGKPLPNAKIAVSNEFKSKGYATKIPIDEYFTADKNGYFCVKFIRRTGHEDVINHFIGINNDTLYYNSNEALNSNGGINISPAELRKSKENIQLGILNLKKNPY